MITIARQLKNLIRNLSKKIRGHIDSNTESHDETISGAHFPFDL